ncbi:shikimate 5-dehydrogenase [Streptomyces inusitatus]|uniref:Shikimate 5-dehydrogenase n=1 Tax=Streptomyces inusitatus TaxID=68221 RepID=A0A918QQG2_9ACTN|nr:shikimate dehydrogenase [Streptomyces inusitatus]GGZ62160.1 shikimate 5-dehydrogenase [Streptomyces inusitatus]
MSDGPVRAAVLGSPIAHSLSPALHRAAHRGMGLDWSYSAVECAEPGLPGFLRGLDSSWAGLSLTMPLKRAVIPLLDSVSDLARAVGGVNTVLLREDGRHGENTDVHGIVAALGEAGVTAPGSAVVLGGGATACSALAALRRLGLPEAVVLVRDRSRAALVEEAAERLGSRISVRSLSSAEGAGARAELVISTLPAGAADGFADALRCEALLDVVYSPWPTRSAGAVAALGGRVVSGLSMLLHQAAAQVSLMTGRTDVPVELMRQAVAAPGAAGG